MPLKSKLYYDEMKKGSVLFFIILLFIFTACSKKSGRDQLKVITLNIRYDNPGDSLNAWPFRAPLVTGFLDKEKPDLIGLQEVLFSQYVYLDSVLIDYASAAAGREDGVRAGEMNPVFFRKDRFDLVRNLTFWLSETPEVPGSKAWNSSLPRIVTWVELANKNTHDHLFFFNTHFAHDSDTARIMSAKLLLSRIDTIATTYPFIVTGDFNSLPGSEPYDILTGPAESVPLLMDAKEISEKNPEGPVYTYNGFSDTSSSNRIDYIFVRNGLKVLDHRVFVKKERRVFISDHWPVEAIVSLSQKK